MSHLCGDFPGLGPAEAMMVHEDAHELRDGNRGVCVVELEGNFVCKEVPGLPVRFHEPPDNILQCCRHEEVLLLQAQLLPLIGSVIGVQH